MQRRKFLSFGSLATLVGASLLAPSAVKGETKPQSATILSTASNSGETSPCG